MKRINELRVLLKKELAALIPNGSYSEFGRIWRGNKRQAGPGVHVYTTLLAVLYHEKIGVEALLCKYLCDVKFVRRETGTTTGSLPNGHTEERHTVLRYRKIPKTEKKR